MNLTYNVGDVVFYRDKEGNSVVKPAMTQK